MPSTKKEGKIIIIRKVQLSSLLRYRKTGIIESCAMSLKNSLLWQRGENTAKERLSLLERYIKKN